MSTILMKAFVTLLLCSSTLATKAEAQIQIVRHGTNVTERPSAALVTNLVELVRSCLYPNYFPVEAATWQKFERSDSFVLVTFATPSTVKLQIVDGDWENRKFKIKESKKEVIDQLLVPLPDAAPGPANIFVRSGTNFLSLSKWDPKRLGMVGCEPALQLASRSYYKALTDIKRADK
jgi:hypothetical protein